MFDAIPETSGRPGPMLDDAEAQHEIPGHVERREKRVGTSIVGAIRLPDGTELPCIIKDISRSGAKLGVPSSCVLPDRFLFKMNNRDLVFQARLAWRKASYAGVAIERIAKLPPGKRPS